MSKEKEEELKIFIATLKAADPFDLRIKRSGDHIIVVYRWWPYGPTQKHIF